MSYDVISVNIIPSRGSYSKIWFHTVQDVMQTYTDRFIIVECDEPTVDASASISAAASIDPLRFSAFSRQLSRKIQKLDGYNDRTKHIQNHGSDTGPFFSCKHRHKQGGLFYATARDISALMDSLVQGMSVQDDQACKKTLNVDIAGQIYRLVLTVPISNPTPPDIHSVAEAGLVGNDLRYYLQNKKSINTTVREKMHVNKAFAEMTFEEYNVHIRCNANQKQWQRYSYVVGVIQPGVRTVPAPVCKNHVEKLNMSPCRYLSDATDGLALALQRVSEETRSRKCIQDKLDKDSREFYLSDAQRTQLVACRQLKIIEKNHEVSRLRDIEYQLQSCFDCLSELSKKQCFATAFDGEDDWPEVPSPCELASERERYGNLSFITKDMSSGYTMEYRQFEDYYKNMVKKYAEYQHAGLVENTMNTFHFSHRGFDFNVECSERSFCVDFDCPCEKIVDPFDYQCLEDIVRYIQRIYFIGNVNEHMNAAWVRSMMDSAPLTTKLKLEKLCSSLPFSFWKDALCK